MSHALRACTNAMLLSLSLAAPMCRHVRVTLDAARGTGSQASVSFRHVQPIVADPVADDGNPASISTDMVTFQVIQVHLSASTNASVAGPVASVGFHVGPQESPNQ